MGVGDKGQSGCTHAKNPMTQWHFYHPEFLLWALCSFHARCQKNHMEKIHALSFFSSSPSMTWGSVQRSILKPCLSPPNNSCSQTYPTWGKAWDTQLLFTLEELGTWGNKITCDSWVLDLNYQPGTPIHRQKKYQLGVPGFYTTEMGLRMANFSCFSLVPINCTLSQILTI